LARTAGFDWWLLSVNRGTDLKGCQIKQKAKPQKEEVTAEVKELGGLAL